MILKAEEIVRLINESSESDDPLIINPEPDTSVLVKSGSASVDLRLGTWFLKLRQERTSVMNVPEDDLNAAEEEARLLKTQYVPFGEEFVLHPRAFVLATTLEWLRLPIDLAGYLIGKSSWGRRGLIIATAVGVHPRFIGCLTLELTNLGEIPIIIKPGMTICQLFLHRVQTSSSVFEQSHFAAMRKPALGSINMDEIAKRLSKTRN